MKIEVIIPINIILLSNQVVNFFFFILIWARHETPACHTHPRTASKCVTSCFKQFTSIRRRTSGIFLSASWAATSTKDQPGACS